MKPLNFLGSPYFGWGEPIRRDEVVSPDYLVNYRHQEDKPYAGTRDSISFENRLPAIAEALNLSDRPGDYIFRPVVVIVSDIPNRNGIGFPLKTLTSWNPERGCFAYETWRGMPMFEEHGKYHPNPDDPDPKLALGVVADVSLRPLRGYGDNKLWKVLMLAAMDRTSGHKLKDKDLVNKVEMGEVNTYSMGALVGGYRCSYCGSPVGLCNHVDKSRSPCFEVIGDHVAYLQCVNIAGVELSVVGDPAVGLASSDFIKLRY